MGSGGMIRLAREIRFSIDRDWVLGAHGAEGFENALPVTNSMGRLAVGSRHRAIFWTPAH